MSAPLAVSVGAALLAVFGTVFGVLAVLTGASLACMGACSAIEGTWKRGLLGLVLGGALAVGGLALTGFLPGP